MFRLKSPTQFVAILGLAAGISFALCAAAGAQIFSEDFESFTAPVGNFNGGPSGQVGTGLDIAHSGSLSGWLQRAVNSHIIQTFLRPEVVQNSFKFGMAIQGVIQYLGQL